MNDLVDFTLNYLVFFGLDAVEHTIRLPAVLKGMLGASTVTYGQNLASQTRRILKFRTHPSF